MKRFAMIFGMLVLTIQIAGCGGPSTPHEDPNRPSEEKEFEAQRKADIEKNIADNEAKAAKKGKR